MASGSNLKQAPAWWHGGDLDLLLGGPLDVAHEAVLARLGEQLERGALQAEADADAQRLDVALLERPELVKGAQVCVARLGRAVRRL